MSSNLDSTLIRRNAVTEMGKPTLPTKLKNSSICYPYCMFIGFLSTVITSAETFLL